MQDKLVLLDYDHSVARIAARMLRSQRICCKILPGDTAAETVLAEDPCGLLLCASHMIRFFRILDGCFLPARFRYWPWGPLRPVWLFIWAARPGH